jgi:uncharacterized protein
MVKENTVGSLNHPASASEVSFEKWFSKQAADIPVTSVASVLLLAAEGATVPFIARYRKEQTGNLDEVAIRKVLEVKELWDEIIKRQTFIKQEIEKQGKLTEDLKKKILGAFDLDVLEDLYLPYKIKKKTKAEIAREAGLKEISEKLWSDLQAGVNFGVLDFEKQASEFISKEKGLATLEDVKNGLVDIFVEKLSEKLELRHWTRDKIFKEGFVWTEKGEKAAASSKFENYFDFTESISSLSEPRNSHRYLALRRGWKEEELRVRVGAPPASYSKENQAEKDKEVATHWESEIINQYLSHISPQKFVSPEKEFFEKVARTAYKVYVFSSIENEVHKKLKEIADTAAVQVFSDNLENLLLSAPFGAKNVLGVDPGQRTGSKLAVVDKSGKFLVSEIIQIHSLAEKKTASLTLARLIRENAIEAIAVGNGTGGREIESFIRQTLKEAAVTVPVVMVSEAGASVYSASTVAREEFPDLDLTIRGAISIARRFQDPLAELVKIDPKSIGVGQYQHDVSQNFLKKSLETVVDSCVNRVGVNLNTASSYLLSRVSGVGEAIAKTIVETRSEKGLFKNKNDLLEIPRLSKKTFELAAGFLRIPGGENILDNTGIHPERYSVIEKWAEKLGLSVKDLLGEKCSVLESQNEFKDEVGPFTFGDILSDLKKPGLDPRDTFVPFEFRPDINEMKDLKQDMLCPGIVTNVTNFGAFVDIGVHQDGLVHLSQLADRYIKDPREVVSPGDRVEVRVLEVDLVKKQIYLSLKKEQKKMATLTPSPKPVKRNESFNQVSPKRNPNQSTGFSSKPQGMSVSKKSDSRQGKKNDNFERPFSAKPPERKSSSSKNLTHNPFLDGLAKLQFSKDSLKGQNKK